MNLESLEPAIAPHSSGTRQWRASRPFRLISGSFAMSPFAAVAFALDPQEAITQFGWEPGNLDPIPIYLDLPTGLCGGRDCQMG
jgi:hypothetical protein